MSLLPVWLRCGNPTEWTYALFQCVPVNAAMLAPDEAAGHHIELGLTGGAALGQVRSSGGAAAAEALDEGNASTSLEVPPSWRRCLGGPAVRAVEAL